MDVLRLRDNRFDSNGRRFSRIGDNWTADVSGDGLEGQSISENQRTLLEKFKDWDFGTLESLRQRGVIDLSGSHLDTGDRKSLRFLEYHPAGDDGFRLDTGNLMGVLRFRDPNGETSVQVEVLSRFDKGKDNHFLNYLLSTVFNCALGAEEVAARRSSLLEVLLDILFVRRLGEAARGGLLRHYREFRNNDWDFKGSLDLARHIRENVPMLHGIAYRKREIDLDVPVNRMILKSALTVNHRHPTFFEDNPDAADALRQLRMDVTEEHDLRMLLSRRDCREPVRHPFFREIWEPFRQIARMILDDEHWTLFNEATDDEEVSGVVFDGSWLWEEYIAKVLKRDFLHCGRSETADGKGLRVFADGYARFYPDFLKKDRSCVLDAKYKRSNPNGGRDDVHQVLCYLLLTGAKLGGLVFPPADEECEGAEAVHAEENGGETVRNGGWSEAKRIESPYSTDASPVFWRCFSWKKIDTDNWGVFCDEMKKQEEALRRRAVADPS